MDMGQIEAFKQRFREFDDERLIENVFNPLTEEAAKATAELLEERGLVGERLELRINAARKEMVSRSGITNHCDHCGQSTLFGSIRLEGRRYCSTRCRDEAALLRTSIDLADDLILEQAYRMKFGTCPKCGKIGDDVEVRDSHILVSLFYVVRTIRNADLQCRPCARKSRLGAAVISLATGWWSIPGIFMTPFIVIRNVWRAFSIKTQPEPTSELYFQARLELARSVPDFSGAGSFGLRTGLVDRSDA